MTISICHFLPSTISICHLHRCFAGRTILCNKPASNPREGVFYYSRTKTRTLKLVCPTTRFTFGYRRNEHVAAQGVTVCTRRSRRGVAHSVRNIGSARNRPERPIQARPSPGGAPAHRHQTPPKPTLGGFERGVTWQYRANRVVPQAVTHPYMMHMLARGQWVRQGSMRSDARLSGEYATTLRVW